MAQAGFRVVLHDIKGEIVKRGIDVIAKNLTPDVEKGRKTEDEKQLILNRIQPSTELINAKYVDLVIEAAVGKKLN